jgi:hypothetical protein
MDTTQHDRDESADIGGAEDTSRPDDPAVVAATAGKTTPERSTENQRPRQPSRRHNRGPPLDDDDEPLVERLAGDLLVGADAIRAYLVYLGMPEGTDPYYLKRAGRWPIGNTGGEGGKLIASKRRLTRHAEKITRGPTAA